MKRARIADLKAHLSAYLSGVRAGGTVVVCDRDTPIARLVPYEEHVDGFVAHDAPRPVSDLRKIPAVRPRGKVDVVRMLRENRDQR